MVEIRRAGKVQAFTIEEFEARVRAGRVHEDTEVRFEPITGDGFVRAGELEWFHDLSLDPVARTATRLDDDVPPVVTAILVGLNIRVWWLGLALDGGNTVSNELTNWLAPILDEGAVWRTVTSGFAHVDLAHIATNLVWFALASALVERVLGRANLVAIYLGSVTFGALASSWGAPISPSLGASGGVFGLIGALVVFGLRYPDLLTRRQRQFFGWAMVPYALVMTYSGFVSANTDNFAHVVGLLSGMAITFALSPRDPAHNRRVQFGLAGIGTAALLAIALLGPRLYPLWTVDHAMRALLAARGRELPVQVELEPDILQYRVPAGWGQVSTLTGRPGFADPRDQAGFSASDDEHDRLVTPEERIETFAKTLRNRYPDLVLPEPVDTTLAGLPAKTLIFEPDSGYAVQWWVVVRGRQSLEVSWWTAPGRAGRMAPLRDRLLANVVWNEPPELVAARKAAEETPSRSSRRRLAEQLARIGEVEQAHAMLTALADEDPSSAPTWVALLELAAIRGDEPPIDQALAAAPEPNVALAAVHFLTLQDRTEEARGLLDLAGGRWPGDKDLRKARLREGLPARRDKETRLPWHLVHDVDGSLRPAAERDALVARPLTLDAARQAESWLDDQTAKAVAIALDAPDRRLEALCYLKYGYVPEDKRAAHGRIWGDIQQITKGKPPAWMPSEIAAVALEPEFLAGIIRPPDDE